MTDDGSRHSDAGDRNANLDAIADTIAPVERVGPRTEIDTTDTLAGDGSGSGDAEIAGALEAERARKNASPSAQLGRGAPIGRFIVIESIGTGGMGEVVAAYDAELDRRVAIKLLRSDASGARLSELAHKRLLREAQAMAKLSHPNVITVYEVGTFGKRVFIAMEYVAGCTLSKWVERGERSWREVVDAYVRAGRGLAAAHGAGLVHRDFKPDNVLVGDDGRVRVTDFGLVAAAGETSQGAPVETAHSPLSVSLTRTGAVMGTPLYMAPEQHQGLPADTRADQFSFSVALYEALYGERPFAGASLSDLRRNVESGEVSTPPRDAGVPSWIRAVLLRGLRSDPAARYSNMESLLDALERDPAVARRRRGVLLGAVLLAGVAAFGLVRGIRTADRPCRDAAARMSGVWDDEARQRVSRSFTSTARGYASDTFARVEKALDEYAESWVAAHADACEDTHVRREQSAQLLDLRMRCLERRRQELGALTELLGKGPDTVVMDGSVRAVFALVDVAACADTDALTAAIPAPEDGKVRARVDALRTRIDEAFALIRAGKYRPALQLAEGLAVEAREVDYRLLHAEAFWLLATAQRENGAAAQAKETFQEVARAAADAHHDELLARAWLKTMSLLGQDLGRNYEAQTLVPVVEASVARAGGSPSLRADLHHGVGAVLYHGGQYVDAHRHLLRALELRQQTQAADSLSVATTLAVVGDVIEELGDYEKAFQHHQRAFAMTERVLGADHPGMVPHLYNLGLSLAERGQFDDARAHLERALVIAEKAFGPEHPDVAGALSNLGNLDIDQGRFASARKRFDQAMSIRQAAHGPDHPTVAVVHANLGRLLWVQGKYAEAWEHHQRSLAIYERVYGREHPEVAIALSNMGNLAQERGDYERAEKLYERALANWQKAQGPNHPDVGMALNNLGTLLLLRGKRAQARLHQEHALAIFERVLGPKHPRVAASLTNLGNLLQAEGRLGQSREYHERAIAIKETTLGPDHPHLATSLNNLGDALYQQGDLESAEKYFNRALTIWEKRLGPDHPDVGIPVHNLGNVFHGRGDYGKAREYQARALAIFEKALGREHPYVAYPLTGLGKALVEAGDPVAALEPLERALAIREHKGSDENDLAETQFALARALWGAKRDKQRALGLARSAQASYARREAAKRDAHGVVADWLRLHKR